MIKGRTVWARNNKIGLRNFKERKSKLIKVICTECENCSSKDNLVFHHTLYRFPPKKEDFIIVCRSCHAKLHKK